MNRLPMAALFVCTVWAALAPASTRPRDAARGWSDLPLVEVPAHGPPSERLAVLLTGDGGWAQADVDLSEALARRGVAVVGWSSPRAFLHRRTPEGAASDLALLLHHFLPASRRSRVILIGYSFGADVMPFLARRLPSDLAASVERVVLLSPSPATDFQFHPLDWILRGRHHPGEREVRPEIEALRRMPVLCVRGTEERESLCDTLSPSIARRAVHPGGHILREGAEDVAREILRRSP